MTVRRKIGEATTVHERNVESAIGRVPEWHGREANYTPLVGGLMNQNWLVEIAGDRRRYFIKVPGEGSEMFIDRVAANEAARNAHAMGNGCFHIKKLAAVGKRIGRDVQHAHDHAAPRHIDGAPADFPIPFAHHEVRLPQARDYSTAAYFFE